MNGIAAALNDEGVPTAKGGIWHASTIRHVLQSIDVDEDLAKVRSGLHRNWLAVTSPSRWPLRVGLLCTPILIAADYGRDSGSCCAALTMTESN